MFEEVPRETRGIARLLARPVVLGPFVIGSGMLVAALGGSVAVATAATVITASAIGSGDLPARPGHAVTPAAPASSHPHSAAIKHPSAQRSGTPPSASPHPSAPPPAAAVPDPVNAGPAPAGNGVRTSTRQVSAAPPAATSRPSATPSSRAVSAPSAPVVSPSSTGPAGNALVYFTGYDQASGRIAYQFAIRESSATGGSELYRVTDRHTFSATLAGSATITSGGTLCPPAGSSCTVDQLLNAVGSGFFAEVAIDAAGALRSVTEVGGQPAAAKAAPTPSTSLSPSSSPLKPPSNPHLARPGSAARTPETGPLARS